MVGSYAESSNTLELRKPLAVFVPLAWLIAGPLNPASFFAFQVWNEPFDLTFWIICIAVPLAIACAGSLFYLREGGFGLTSLSLVFLLVALAACSVTGPACTFVLSGLEEAGIYLHVLPVSTMSQAILTSGTLIRLGLTLVAIPAIPAIILLRLIAFQREPKKPRR